MGRGTASAVAAVVSHDFQEPLRKMPVDMGNACISWKALHSRGFPWADQKRDSFPLGLAQLQQSRMVWGLSASRPTVETRVVVMHR